MSLEVLALLLTKNFNQTFGFRIIECPFFPQILGCLHLQQEQELRDHAQDPKKLSVLSLQAVRAGGYEAQLGSRRRRPQEEADDRRRLLLVRRSRSRGFSVLSWCRRGSNCRPVQGGFRCDPGICGQHEQNKASDGTHLSRGTLNVFFHVKI